MTRNTMPIIYGVLAILAIGLGLFVANFFGSSTVNAPAPNSNSTVSAPAPTSGPAPTVPTLAPTAAATQASQATSAPTNTATATIDVTATAAAVTATATINVTATVAAPAATAQSTATSAYTEYTVQPGDSLKAIAQRYNVTVQQILDINDIPNPDSLTVGAVLKIPAS